MVNFSVGCHVSAAGGVWNAPKNAHDLGCEVFQIFTRPPMGGKASPIDDLVIERFKEEMEKYGFTDFVAHCPYYINFGSSKSRIYQGSISVVREELERASLLGARYIMTHLGSFKDLGAEKGMKQAKQGLKEVLKGYKGKTEFLLEIAAGSGETIGGSFEQLAELMEPLVKIKGFGGICFDTQHAFSSGYDLRDEKSVKATFDKLEKVIGLKWLKMSHINDSKVGLSAHKDRHEHIGDGKMGKKSFEAILGYFGANLPTTSPSVPSRTRGGKSNMDNLCLILETEHDKVKADIKILKSIRDKNSPG